MTYIFTCYTQEEIKSFDFKSFSPDSEFLSKVIAQLSMFTWVFVDLFSRQLIVC